MTLPVLFLLSLQSIIDVFWSKMYPFQVNDGEEMRAAIECGRLSEKVDSAYCVGCVIVHKPSKQVVSSGFSRELPGNTHAEECALMKLESSMKDLGIEGKIHELTLYTTMEPCSRRLSGKKSCTERIIEFGISRVEFGILEPKIFVQCQGSDILKAKGIEILQTQDISLQRDCSLLNSHLLQIQ